MDEYNQNSHHFHYFHYPFHSILIQLINATYILRLHSPHIIPSLYYLQIYISQAISHGRCVVPDVSIYCSYCDRYSLNVTNKWTPLILPKPLVYILATGFGISATCFQDFEFARGDTYWSNWDCSHLFFICCHSFFKLLLEAVETPVGPFWDCLATCLLFLLPLVFKLLLELLATPVDSFWDCLATSFFLSLPPIFKLLFELVAAPGCHLNILLPLDLVTCLATNSSYCAALYTRIFLLPLVSLTCLATDSEASGTTVHGVHTLFEQVARTPGIGSEYLLCHPLISSGMHKVQVVLELWFCDPGIESQQMSMGGST